MIKYIFKWMGFIFIWFLTYGCLVYVIGVLLSTFGVNVDMIFICGISVIWTSLLADDLYGLSDL